jgi:two-component system KDP operon response regulator KdpE
MAVVAQPMTEQPPVVLVVDDEAQIRRFLRAGFELDGFTVNEAANAAEGLRSATLRPLDLGADDYVVKPFGMAELLARARVSLRRHTRAPSTASVVNVDRLKIDFARRAVTLDGIRVTLTPKEYRLLQILAQHAGSVVTHQHLLKEVWGQPHVQDTHYLRIFVRKLRQKIEADPNRPRILLTELGVGYRLGIHTEVGERLEA